MRTSDLAGETLKMSSALVLNEATFDDAAKSLIVDVDGLRDAFLHRAVEGTAAMQALCHHLSVVAGWWDNSDPRNPETFATKLCLIHSEVSEAMEGNRKNIIDAHLPNRRADEVELADAVIRIFDLAAARNMDLVGAMVEKLAYNRRRADHSREARKAAGGKVY